METRGHDRCYLFNIGLSLGTMAGLGLSIPAPLTLVLGREGGARGVGGIGHSKSYVARRRRHHVRQSRK